MDAPPTVSNSGRVHLRTAWRDIGPSTEIKLKLNQPVNEQQLEEARQKIIEVYQGRGYNDVSVQFRVDPIDEKRGTARVVFTVNEGVKGAVRQVHFEGNQHFSEKVLRKQ